eukprot:gene15962-21661_t
MGFYHIYSSYNVHEQIIREQIEHLKKTGAYDIISSIKYTVVGDHDYVINDKKFVHDEYMREGHEMQSLSKLYDYCKKNESDFVLYFHPKGSFSESGSKKSAENHLFRIMLDNFVLHKDCYQALLAGYDVCGARLSPLPFLHYSGNFWWARCQYVIKLINPKALYIGSELQIKSFEVFNDIPTFCMGVDRYSAEAWIGSGSIMNGADCLPKELGYVYGYIIPSKIKKMAERNRYYTQTKIHCAKAVMNTTRFISDFYHRYWVKRKELYNYYRCGTIEQNIKRTRLWYNNSDQTSLLKIRAKYGDYPGVNVSRVSFDIPWNIWLQNNNDVRVPVRSTVLLAFFKRHFIDFLTFCFEK